MSDSSVSHDSSEHFSIPMSINSENGMSSRKISRYEFSTHLNLMISDKGRFVNKDNIIYPDNNSSGILK